MIEGACSFKGRYLAGRIKGLSKLDTARRAPGYAAVTYKLGEVTMTSMSGVTAAAAGGGAGALPNGGGGGGARRAADDGNRLAPTLEKLAQRQVGALLRADAVLEAAAGAGLSPARLMEQRRWQQQQRAGGPAAAAAAGTVSPEARAAWTRGPVGAGRLALGGSRGGQGVGLAQVEEAAAPQQRSFEHHPDAEAWSRLEIAQ